MSKNYTWGVEDCTIHKNHVLQEVVNLCRSFEKVGYSVISLEEILAVEMPDTQKEYNLLSDLKTEAKCLKEELDLWSFLEKSSSEIIEEIKNNSSVKNLELCGKKVLWLKENGEHLEASALEGEIREVAKKYHKIRKETLDLVFEEKRAPKDEKMPDFECYGYDHAQNILLGVKGKVETIPVTKLEKMIPSCLVLRSMLTLFINGSAMKRDLRDKSVPKGF